MNRVPEETIEAITAATDIVELISRYIPVKRAGSQFKANCPFHNERTPSFSISPQRQSFHCFGCGESGGAIGFVMKYENLPFIDAVKKLAGEAGIPIIEDAYDPKEDKVRRRRSKLITLHNESTEFMHKLLMRSPAAEHGRDYLKSRGFGPEMAKRWKIGWMPDDFDTFIQWAKSSGYKGRELIDASLAGLRDENNPAKGIYIKFRNRLMFPIHNDYGDVIAFSGRQLVEDPRSGKYVNSNETVLFKKSKVFFGLDKAKKHMTKNGFALLCEGQVDVISCVEAGIENAVAGLGTALTEDHARILKRYTPNATLCFDADGAGYKAAEKAFAELVKQGLNVKVVKMPKGEDPDTLIKKEGVDAFRKLVEEASDFFDFKFEVAHEQIDLNDIQQRTVFSADIANLVALIPDKLTKEAFIQQISGRLGIGASEFREKVTGGERKKNYENSYQKKVYSSPDAEINSPPPPVPVDRVIGALCVYAMYDQKSMEYLCEQLEAIHEPISISQGGNLLLKILAKRPKCDTPAALHTFMLNLSEPERQGLATPLTEALPENILSATQETTSMLINSHLQRRDSAIRSAMRQPNLTKEEKQDLLTEAQEIANLLQGLSQRYIR